MSNIISDVSKRVLKVKGEAEVERIKELYHNVDLIIKITNIEFDVWEIELIQRVGDYFNSNRK